MRSTPRPGPRSNPRPASQLGRREPSDQPADFLVECVGGLEPFVAAELARMRPSSPARWDASVPGELRARFAGPWRLLLTLRTATAVHVRVVSGVPRPAALLDDGTLKRLLAVIGHIRSLHSGGAFRTVRLGAAGADSSTLRRLRDRVTAATGLDDVEDGGDLLLRVRRVSDNGSAALDRRLPRDGRDPRDAGFELTARISPRPLAARAWRRCDLPGALNATVAAVMADLTQPTPDDVYLNLACGSGTLLVERAQAGPARRLIGCDVDPATLACAAENVAGATLANIELQPWDVTSLPLGDGSIDALTVDLPFGQLVGSHETNERLYPRLLVEAARVARPSARLVAITLQSRLFERLAAEQHASWEVERSLRLAIPTNAAPIAPRVYVLRRRGRD